MSEGEAPKELRVSPVTLYKSTRVSPYGDLISVNERYISYPIRNGLIRVIHQKSVNRILLREHEHHAVTELAFFNGQRDVLLSSGTDDLIHVWTLIEQEDNSITKKVIKTIPIQAQRVRWHPNDENRMAIMQGTRVEVLDVSTVHGLIPPDELDSISIFCIGHTSQVNDIGFSSNGHVLLSASSDGRVLLHSLWQIPISCEVPPQRIVVPFQGENVSRILIGSGEEGQVLFGSKGGQVLSIWNHVMTPTIEPTKAQTLSIHTTNANSNFMVAMDPTSEFVYVADQHAPVLFVVHVGSGPLGLRMDNICEFQLVHPILSMAITNRIPTRLDPPLITPLEMQLFCIQTKAIQQYHVLADECFMPIVSVSTSGQSVGVVATEHTPVLPQQLSSSPPPHETDLKQHHESVAADLLEQMSRTIQQTLRQEFQSVLIPAIGRIVLHTTEKNMLVPIQQSLKALSSSAHEPLDQASLVDTIAQQVREPVRDSFRECFQASIIPSFQAATQKMLGQINTTITKQMSARDELTNQIQRMQSQLTALTQTVASLTETLSKQASFTSDVTITAVPKQETDAEQLLKLVEASDYDGAFEKALSAQNLDLVYFVCQQTESSVVLDNASPTLSSMTLLCLIQQLGSNMSNHLTMKLDWLRDALLVLDTTDESIVSLMPQVLSQLQDQMNTVLPESRNSKFVILQHILKSTRSSNQ